MQGGEIFVPKIPSVKIMDLASAYAPNIPIEIIGIRPGEKIHEVMCPADDSHRTLEFSEHFVIIPTIKFYDGDICFSKNRLGEQGQPVEYGYEYNSGNNPVFLSQDEILSFESTF